MAVNRAESGASNNGVRIVEPGSVGKVYKFPAELQHHALPQFEILEDGRVEIVYSITAQPRVITWRVAGDLVSRVREGTGISKKAFAIHDLFDAETGARIARDIGPLTAIS